MTNYRAVVKHVRYWRGQIHKWSTSYLMTGSLLVPLDTTAAQTLMLADNKMCYVDTAGNKAGGAYACSIYLASGGTPLCHYQAFDPDVPSGWINPVGSVWIATTAVVDPTAENAALLEWPAGLSTSGKPVKFRKWYHQVPTSTAIAGAVQVDAAHQLAMATQANAIAVCLFGTYGIALGSPGRLPGLAVCSPYYGNHQMPKGRRRTLGVAKSEADFGKILSILQGEASDG